MFVMLDALDFKLSASMQPCLILYWSHAPCRRLLALLYTKFVVQLKLYMHTHMLEPSTCTLIWSDQTHCRYNVLLAVIIYLQLQCAEAAFITIIRHHSIKACIPNCTWARIIFSKIFAIHAWMQIMNDEFECGLHEAMLAMSHGTYVHEMAGALWLKSTLYFCLESCCEHPVCI